MELTRARFFAGKWLTSKIFLKIMRNFDNFLFRTAYQPNIAAEEIQGVFAAYLQKYNLEEY